MNNKNKTDTVGILSIIFAILFAPVGLVLGLIGARDAKKEHRSPVLSRIGWIIGLILTVWAVIVILGLLLLVIGFKHNYQF